MFSSDVNKIILVFWIVVLNILLAVLAVCEILNWFCRHKGAKIDPDYNHNYRE